jgi:hypothetical protein
MTWYAVSAILAFRFKEGEQDVWPVWENVYLVSAESPEAAEEKAAVVARRAAGDDDGSLTCGGRPATREFCGIRKVMTIASPPLSPVGEPVDGAEVTYSELELSSQRELQDLVDGKAVVVKYME